MPTATPNAMADACPRSRRPGFTASPINVMTGSTIQPVSRSRTTEANVVGVCPLSRASRETRRASPPMVLGNTLPMNWPAK